LFFNKFLHIILSKIPLTQLIQFLYFFCGFGFGHGHQRSVVVQFIYNFPVFFFIYCHASIMMDEFRYNQAIKIRSGLTVINALNIVIGVEIAIGRWHLNYQCSISMLNCTTKCLKPLPYKCNRPHNLGSCHPDEGGNYLLQKIFFYLK